jgi:release factor glutamine methyltransferase
VATLAESVRAASRALETAGWDPSSAWLDAEVLARSILRWNLTDWLSRQAEPAGTSFRAAFEAALARRLRHEPVAYITGEREFYGRSFIVGPAVLIPRPETELLVDEGLAVLAERIATIGPSPRILDVGTGSGILAVTLALESPTSRLMATDVSPAALAVAADNVARFDVADRVELRHASLVGTESDRTFDLVVSNPPYVAEHDRPDLMPDVRDYEPAVALFGGPDGLMVIRDLIPAAARVLRPGGWLVMELGAGQAARVSHLLERAAVLTLVRIVTDLAGIPRVLVARRPPT